MGIKATSSAYALRNWNCIFANSLSSTGGTVNFTFAKQKNVSIIFSFLKQFVIQNKIRNFALIE